MEEDMSFQRTSNEYPDPILKLVDMVEDFVKKEGRGKRVRPQYWFEKRSYRNLFEWDVTRVEVLR